MSTGQTALTAPEEPIGSGENGSRCIMIGPSGSGKTKLLMAIHRACHLQPPDQPGLEFVSQHKNTHNLISRSVEIMMNQDRDTVTGHYENHEFEISMLSEREREQGRPGRVVRFYLTDPPGEALFPTHREGDFKLSQQLPHLIEAGQQAASIVLCVDVQERHWRIYRHLPGLLGEMVTSQEVPDESVWSNIARFFQRRPQRTARIRRLQCDRFLLLLTKVDQISDIAFRELRRAGKYVPPAEFNYFRPLELAQLISPIGQARAVLGVDVLKTIRAALKPQAELAVGISSAGGFDVSGLPFLDFNGRPVGVNANSTSEFLRRWIPFGVREAVLFAAFGVYTPTVQKVTAEHLWHQSTGEQVIAST